MKSILSYSRADIEAGLAAYAPTAKNRLRVLFAPVHITEENFETACRLYANLKNTSYDDVIIIERFLDNGTKRLPMISDAIIETPLGEVPVNDVLRNDFCDEDDDFYIDDLGRHENMSLPEHLMMLQCTLANDFRVLSLQITDERPSIVRELAAGVAEILRERNALIIVCAEAAEADKNGLQEVQRLAAEQNFSRMLNYINTGDAGVQGGGPLAAGILLSHNWELETCLMIPGKDAHIACLAGYAGLPVYETQS
ncbi:MAG: AmmeMemoRadiSam system protein B [Cyclonatronaceae bacterium]